MLAAAALPLAGGEGETNRVRNGDFEEGPAGAAELPGWTEVDGLTTFFVKEPGHGRVLMIDTDVNLAEADARWTEMALPKDERPAAKPKGETKEPKYDTVGGTTGAKIYSDYIRVEPGMRYRLRVDAKTEGPEILVFVKGYAEFEGGYRKFYQCYKKVPAGESEWKTFERTFDPTRHSPEVTHIRVMPYAYWPPGRAFVDRVEVTRDGPEKEGPPAPGTNLLANGGFEGADLAPFAVEGTADRVQVGSDGCVVRLSAGSSLSTPPVAIEDGRRYLFRARFRAEGARPLVVVEMLVRMEGKEYALGEARGRPPEGGGGWADFELPFHPTEETPQVARVRARILAEGAAGALLVDDVSLEPLEEAPK